jgi:hypothetical protein
VAATEAIRLRRGRGLSNKDLEFREDNSLINPKCAAPAITRENPAFRVRMPWAFR